MGQLYSYYRDFQSNFWVKLRILGQPCGFYLLAGAAPPPAGQALRLPTQAPAPPAHQRQQPGLS
jgi:hypothetical protein